MSFVPETRQCRLCHATGQRWVPRFVRRSGRVGGAYWATCYRCKGVGSYLTRKPGRKRLGDRKRSLVIGVRVTPNEAAQLHGLAAAFNMTISAITYKMFQDVLKRYIENVNTN